jgi:serine/threonine protein kinase
MEGGELFHQIVKLTYFSEELSRHVILQVAHAIRYLHEEKGVVHRSVFLVRPLVSATRF